MAAKKRSNNRLEFALARPTRKSEALLLAAQPERYKAPRVARVQEAPGTDGRAIGEGVAVSASIIVHRTSSAEEIGMAASVIALRVSVAKKSESAAPVSASVREFRRRGGNREVRFLGDLGANMSIVRKPGRMSRSGFRRGGLPQATASYNNALKRRRAKTHAP